MKIIRTILIAITPIVTPVSALILAVFAALVIWGVSGKAADVTYPTSRGTESVKRDLGAGTDYATISADPYHYVASHAALAVAATTYYVLLDLSNTTDYPHTTTDELIITGAGMQIVQSAASATWGLSYALVTAIDGSGITVEVIFFVQPSEIALTGECNLIYPPGGWNTDDFIAADINIAAVTTSTSLGSPAGATTVGVGDILVYVTELTGAATVNWTAYLTYMTQ